MIWAGETSGAATANNQDVIVLYNRPITPAGWILIHG
jgi:hypothetical protein